MLALIDVEKIYVCWFFLSCPSHIQHQGQASNWQDIDENHANNGLWPFQCKTMDVKFIYAVDLLGDGMAGVGGRLLREAEA